MRGRAHAELRAQVARPGCAAAASSRSRRDGRADLRAAAGAWSRARRAARRRPAASRAAARRCASARYSVCPVNGTPASLMTLFCTGAVTIAWNSPAAQPSMAHVERLEHVARVAQRPGCRAVHGTASGTCSSSTPARWRARPRRSRGRLELAGAARSRAAEQGAVADQDDTAAGRAPRRAVRGRDPGRCRPVRRS